MKLSFHPFFSTLEKNILKKLANKFKTDKGTIKGAKHGYVIDYFYHFQHLQNKPINILEIGVGRGQSLLTWDSFFTHSESKIVGIDNNCDKNYYKFEVLDFNDTKISVYDVDQGDRSQLSEWINKLGIKFDIIIDDGAHLSKEQQISLGVLFPFVKPKGFYVIEDLATMYRWPKELNYDKNTLNLIKEFMKNKTFNSEYMTDNEIKYLIEQSSKSFLYDDHYLENITTKYKRRDQLWILNKK